MGLWGDWVRYVRGFFLRHARSPLSGRPTATPVATGVQSLCFCYLLASSIKACPRPRAGDSGFRIGEEYSRYASLFLYRTE